MTFTLDELAERLSSMFPAITRTPSSQPWQFLHITDPNRPGVTLVTIQTEDGNVVSTYDLKNLDQHKLLDNREETFAAILGHLINSQTEHNLGLADFEALIQSSPLGPGNESTTKERRSTTIHYDPLALDHFITVATAMAADFFAPDRNNFDTDIFVTDSKALPPNFEYEGKTALQETRSARKWASRQAKFIGINIKDEQREVAENYLDLIRESAGNNDNSVLDYLIYSRILGSARSCRNSIGEEIYQIIHWNQDASDLPAIQVVPALRHITYQKLIHDDNASVTNRTRAAKLFADSTTLWLQYAYTRQMRTHEDVERLKSKADEYTETIATRDDTDASWVRVGAKVLATQGELNASVRDKSLRMLVRDGWLRDEYALGKEGTGILGYRPTLQLASMMSTVHSPTVHASIRYAEYSAALKEAGFEPPNLFSARRKDPSLKLRELEPLIVEAYDGLANKEHLFRRLGSNSPLALPETGDALYTEHQYVSRILRVVAVANTIEFNTK